MARTSRSQRIWLRLGRLMARPVAFVAAAVLTLAVLNPLLCILHCAMAHRYHPAFVGAEHLFLCDLSEDPRPAAAPFEQVWSGPRAVFDAVLLLAPALTLHATFVVLVAAVRLCTPQHFPGPILPPPKS